MNTFTRMVLAMAAGAFATQAAADITLYEREGYGGRSFTTDDRRVESIGDLAGSVEITDDRIWEVCDDTHFRGWCVRLSPGNYPTIRSMGMRARIASVRRVDPPDAYVGDSRDYSRRGGERLFDADVISVRAVMGADEQRCWVEREQVSRGNPGGAIAGAVIGGFLGHQVGHGSNRTGATVGGAVVGGAVGANVGDRRGYQDVQRCQNVPAQAPAFWDVTYIFRGQEHRVQMSSPPGARITVNQFGEPRA
jgi:hypothetical protein